MRRRPLGRTGLLVSEIGFGCGPTADLIVSGDQAAQRRAVGLALELGVDYFDTAPLYGDGASEANLGRALYSLGARPAVATKVVLSLEDLADIRGAVLRSVQASLDRLGLPRVAMIQLHNRVGERREAKAEFGSGAVLTADDLLARGGVADAFRELRRKGLVEAFGCSAYGGDMPVVERVIDSGAFDALTVNYSLLNATAWRPSLETGVRDYRGVAARAASAGMGLVAIRVLEAGLLTDAPVAPTARLAPDRAEMEQRLALLRPHLGDAEPMSRTALRFVLSNAKISTALVGFSNPAQIEAAAAASEAGELPLLATARINAWRARAASPYADAATNLDL